jgi:hypothetical protein
LDDWPTWVVDFRPNATQACAAMEAKQAIEKHVDPLSAGVHSAFPLRVLEGLSAKSCSGKKPVRWLSFSLRWRMNGARDK